ncbi:MAG: hypothetical protein J6X66_05015 [Lachnospiraceae bacterium]|nr:hypothetical protein [Lachnospiraceae bacterium]
MGKKNRHQKEYDSVRPKESAMPPLPEYEEGSLEARKADILEQVGREIADEGSESVQYRSRADMMRNAFYADDIIGPLDQQPLDNEEDVREEALALQDTFNDGRKKKGLRNWIETHRAACLAVALTVIVLCGVLFALWLHSRSSEMPGKGKAVSLDASSSNNTAVSEDASLAADDPLILNEEADLNELIKKYFEARENRDIDTYSSLRSYTDSLEQAKLEAKSEYIEGYRNLKCYTKKGPYDNSYMVYVSYDLKLKEWEKTVPALETLVVCRKEAEGDQPGELYVYSGSFDEGVVDYIQAVTAQDDVVDLFKRIDTEYQEIMDADPDYEEYMASLKQLIRDGVGVRLAAAADSKDDTDAVSDNETDGDKENDAETGEEQVSENQAEPQPVVPSEFEVEATTYVNVRASDSENADRIGNVGPGTRLTCKEQLANGWSHVIYEGKDAYIKSEYLTVVGEELKVKGKVNVISTVNIRAKADINSELLGVAFAGTTYDMIEDEKDGWTAIVYNGKQAFIKSEYLEVQ